MEGRFDPTRPDVLVTPRSPPHGTPEKLIPTTSNNGVLVFSLFTPIEGRQRLLVNRGWWPAGVVPTPVPQGRVTVAGVIRQGEDVSCVGSA